MQYAFWRREANLYWLILGFNKETEEKETYAYQGRQKGGSGGTEEPGRRVVWGTWPPPPQKKNYFFTFFFSFWRRLGRHLPQALTQVVTALAIAISKIKILIVFSYIPDYLNVCSNKLWQFYKINSWSLFSVLDQLIKLPFSYSWAESYFTINNIYIYFPFTL